MPRRAAAGQSAARARIGVAGATATATAGSLGAIGSGSGSRDPQSRLSGLQAEGANASDAARGGIAAGRGRRGGRFGRRPAGGRERASGRARSRGRCVRGRVRARRCADDGSRRVDRCGPRPSGRIDRGAAWLLARLRRINGNGALLHHHADLLRELDPAHRARVHDDCGGHPCPPPASAWRRNVLPDRGRRARREGRTRRRGAGLVAAGVRRPDRGRLA